MQYRARYKVIVCGRRWGKTTMAINQLILEAVANEQGAEFWYIAPTYRQAKSIAWKMLKNQWIALPPPLRGQRNESELSVEIRNSKIVLKGADNEDSLRGLGLGGVVCDEVASYRNWKYLWENVLRPALSDKKGFAWFISTPKGFNHFYDLFNQQNEDKDFKSFHFTTYDNPFIAVEEIEKAKSELTDDAFAQEYLADFRKHTGLIYKEFDRAIHVISPRDFPREWRHYRGIDFGKVNKTACLWICLDNYDTIYVYDEYYNSEAKTETHASIINHKTRHPIIATYGDPSGAQQILDYAGYELLIIPATKQYAGKEDWVTSGINKVAELLKHNLNQHPRFYVTSNCKNTIKEFETYHWIETKGGETQKDMPEKVNDHAMDALRYFVVSYTNTQHEKDFEPSQEIHPNEFTGW